MEPAALLALMTFFATPPSAAKAPEDGTEPVELGDVLWERDHDAAFARARASGRPVLLLFQEIPG